MITEPLMDGSEVAVVGMAGRFPGAPTLDRFWENLRGGVESIRRVSDEELRAAGVAGSALRAPNYVKAAATLDGVDRFAASYFGFSPHEAALMDPQHRIFLECASDALEHAGCNPESFPGLIGVYAGTSLSSYLLFNVLEAPGMRAAEDTFPLMVGNDKDFLSTRVSYHLNLRGPSIDVQTGCSTSLVAVHLACEALLSCQCDVALAGGVSVDVPQRTGYYYNAGGVTSPDGHCRPFDALARGTVFGSGAGIVVLKRLADARDAGDTVYAVIKGSAINNDGATKVGYTAPSVEGQAEVIARAHAVAGVAADTIGYLEAHGTATPLGDPVEVQALTKVFRASTDATASCAIGSVKANIGHLDAAAGVAGLIKTVLALRHREIPPLVNFARPNPHIDFAATPFYVTTAPIPWRSSGAPRRAGVSSFGIGGTNAHVVVEEAPPAGESDAAPGPHVLVLSAKTGTALSAAACSLAGHLRNHPEQEVADVAFTLQLGRRALKHRAVLVCERRDEAAAALAAGGSDRLLQAVAPAAHRSAAFLFPGQGTQYVGMARGLYEREPVVREEVDRCCRVLAPILERDLRTVLFADGACREAAAQLLAQTAIAQPALFAIEYALARLWISWGVRPAATIGHSVGEYVAATLAGVFTLEDALALVACRGRLMQQTAAGAMVAVSLGESDVVPLVQGGGLSLAAVNGPRQCVLSGTAAAIAELEAKLEAGGIVHQRLATSRAFHSTLMEPVVDAFADAARRVERRPPEVPLVSNVTGTWMTRDEAVDPGYWARHLRTTVRFADGLATLAREPGLALLEVGPGRTLAGLAQAHPARPAEQPAIATLGDVRQADAEPAAARTALGRLWLAGVDVDWSALHDGRRRRVPLPTYPFERERYWIDPAPRPERAGAERADAADWFYLPVWKRTLPPAPAVAGEPAAHWLVMSDRTRLSDGIVRRLAALGHRTTVLVAGPRFTALGAGGYQLDPRSPDDYARAIGALAGSPPDRVLHLWNAGPPAPAGDGPDAFERAQATGLYSLLHLSRALAGLKPCATHLARHRDRPMRIHVVASGLHDVTGDEPLRPEHATVLGFCDVLPQELADVTCHAIDIDAASRPGDDERLVEQILAELLAAEPAPAAAWRHGSRWVPGFEPLHLDANASLPVPLRARGVYLIAGGLGSIGLALAEHLASTVEARLVLVSRSPIPARADWKGWLEHGGDDAVTHAIRRLQAIEARGGRVLAASADLADAGAMRAVVEHAYAGFGALNGVIHAAGVAGSAALRPAADVDPADCRRHFQARVNGLYVLDRVTGDHPLDFRLLFSSNASVLGGPGLLAYAAAHRFIDAYACSRSRSRSGAWLSVSWDPWILPGGGAAPGAASGGLRRYAVTPDEGTDALRRILARTVSGHVVVSTGDLRTRVERWIDGRGRGEPEPAGERPSHSRPPLETGYVPPRNRIERAVIEVWQACLGISQVGVHDNFFELGGTSLIAAEVVKRLNASLQLELPIVRLFERPTVSALVASIADDADGEASTKGRHSRGARRRELGQERWTRA